MSNDMTDERRELIEELASELHDVYMKEASRQGDVRHAEEYKDLPEHIKNYDRALARFILADRRRILEEVEEPLKDMEHNGYGWEYQKAIDEALTRIAKLKGEQCQQNT